MSTNTALVVMVGLMTFILLSMCTTAKVGTGPYVPDGAYCSRDVFNGTAAVAHIESVDISLTFMKSKAFAGCHHIKAAKFFVDNPEDVPLNATTIPMGPWDDAGYPISCRLRIGNLFFNVTSQTINFEVWNFDTGRTIANAVLAPCSQDGDDLGPMGNATMTCDSANTFCTEDNRLTVQYLPDNRYQVEARPSPSSPTSSLCIASGYYVRDRGGKFAFYQVNQNSACESMHFDMETLADVPYHDCKFRSTFSIQHEVSPNQLLSSSMCAIMSNTSSCFAQPDCSSCAASPGCVWCGHTERCMYNPATQAEKSGQFKCLYDQRSPYTCRNGDRPVSTSVCGGVPWNPYIPSIVNFNADTQSFTWGMLDASYVWDYSTAPAKACCMTGTYYINADNSIKYLPVLSTCPSWDKLYFMSFNDTVPSEPNLSLQASNFEWWHQRSPAATLTTCKNTSTVYPRCGLTTGKTLCSKDRNAMWTLDGNNRFTHTTTNVNNTRCTYSGFFIQLWQYQFNHFGLLYTQKSDADCPDQKYTELHSHENCSVTLLYQRYLNVSSVELSEDQCHPSPPASSPNDSHHTESHKLSRAALAGIVVAAIVVVVAAAAVVIILSRSKGSSSSSDGVTMVEKEGLINNGV